jgi:hypothetical protein
MRRLDQVGAPGGGGAGRRWSAEEMGIGGDELGSFHAPVVPPVKANKIPGSGLKISLTAGGFPADNLGGGATPQVKRVLEVGSSGC